MDNTLMIAEQAMRNYQLKILDYTPIGESSSTVYKLADTQGNCYSLRLHITKSETVDKKWTEPDVLRSEMIWLDALSNESGLVVPNPIKNNDGDYITKVEDVLCTLLSWVEGEKRIPVATERDITAVGEMIGKLHKHASRWQFPASFARPCFDEERTFLSINMLAERVERGELSGESTSILIEAGEKAVARAQLLERTNSTWGVINADLHPGNFLFVGNEARPIDFDTCGFGYYLSDLGWTFSYIHPCFRQLLLASYQNHFVLPQNHIDLIESFFIMGQLDTMIFWLGLPDVYDWLPNHIKRLASREFLRYINNASFLFDGTPYWE